MPIPLDVINAHPRDKYIFMDEKQHIYYLNGKPISISGTGFLHFFFEPFDKKKVAKGCMERAKPGTKYYGKTIDEICKIWDEGSRDGTAMHLNIENFYNGIEPFKGIGNRDRFGVFAKLYPKLIAFGLVPYRTEWIIYDKDYDIAGSIDFVAYNKETGKYWIIDWKRSNGLSRESFGGKKGYFCASDMDDCNGNHYQIQVNLYKHILEKNYGIEIEQCLVVNLHPKLSEPDMLFAEDYNDKIQEMIKYWLKHKKELLANRH